MINQSTFTSGTSHSHSPEPQLEIQKGKLGSTAVTIAAGITSFFQSLDPRYVPANLQQPDQHVGFPSLNTIGATEAPGNSQSMWLGVELGARLISAHVPLPDEVVNLLGGVVSMLTGYHVVSDFRDDLDDTEATLESETLADPVSDNDDKNALDEEPDSQNRVKYSSASRKQATSTSQMKTVLALGALSSLGVADAEPTQATKTAKCIEVRNTKTLEKIGRKHYPLDACFEQVADIDASNLNGSIADGDVPFTGTYNGNGHAIANLKHCLIHRNRGQLHDLRFTHANVTSGSSSGMGVASCTMEPNAVTDHLEFEDCHVMTSGSYANAGLVAGRINFNSYYGNSTKIRNTIAKNCSVETTGKYADAGGISGGIATRTTIENTRFEDCVINASGDESYAAVVGGIFYGNSAAINTTADNCSVTTAGQHPRGGYEGILRGADAGIGAGRVSDSTKLVDTTARNCVVKTIGSGSAGIAAGQVQKMASINNTLADNCKVSVSHYSKGGAGIGAGQALNSATISNTRSLNSTVVAQWRSAGIGVGRASGGFFGIVGKNNLVPITVANTTSINSTTSGKAAGIGSGDATFSIIDGVFAVDSTVSSSGFGGIGGGSFSVATTLQNVEAERCTVRIRGEGGGGIGAGSVSGGMTYSTSGRTYNPSSLTNVTARECLVEMSGGRTGSAGIGAGLVESCSRVSNTRAEDCVVKASGYNVKTGVGAGNTYSYKTEVVGTTAIRTTVEASGEFAYAGIGIGGDGVVVDYTRAENCTINASGEGSVARINGGLNVNISNVCVNGGGVFCSAKALPLLTSSTVAITVGSLCGTAIAGYLGYQWITGYREGLTGKELLCRPFSFNCRETQRESEGAAVYTAAYTAATEND